MKKLAILSLVAILAISCNAQDKNNKDIAQNNPKKPTNKPPKGNWTVNKEVDENGNIIKYDSIYSWSSTDNLKGLNQEQLDSVMQHSYSSISKYFSSSMGNDISQFFENDSLMSKDFFGNDFFENGFGSQNNLMQKMRKRMEHMQQQFIQQQQIIPAVPERNEDNKNNL